ncbi:MAG: PilZ domain-containing protein [Sphingomicrobium sp.]
MLRKFTKGFRGRERRIEVAFDAKLIEADGCEVDVTLLDVSSSGFRVKTNAVLDVGAEVQLVLERSDPLRAVICWARGNEAGGIFLDPVPAVD